MNLTKTKYVEGVICEKRLWLSCYKPSEADSFENEMVFERGEKVGSLARSLFGDYVLINSDRGLQSMIDDTQREIKNKTNIICEASFSYDGNFCSVDLLKNVGDGVELYEVKSSTKIKDIYIHDASYQTWILKKCGLNVKKTYIIYVNGEYIKRGELDIKEFFIIMDITDIIDLSKVEINAKKYKQIINSANEPQIDLSVSCHKPYICPFFKYCTRELPSPNVFDIGWNVNFDKKIGMYKRNHITFDEIINNEVVNDRAAVQLRFALSNGTLKINKANIKMLLNSFIYPLYFLDFESYQSSIPTIDGTKPYQQICFQYSLHYYLEEDGQLYHKEFLSKDYNGNPMRELCKKLCEDIPMNSCVVVYNQSFEKARLKEMALLFPEFREHLLNIRDNIIDLMYPFSHQDYYIKEMGGGWSIKTVLPALFPNDPNLDYHNLEQVHKGDEASNAFLSLSIKSDEEQKKLRENMLRYCRLDTYAMVRIYEKLKEAIE